MAVRFAIIGCGKITERLSLPSLDGFDGAEVKVLCDIKKSKAQNLKAMFNLDAEICTDWKKIIKRKDIDAVAVNTPNSLHAPMTIAFCNAKKHVIVEKPIATSMKEAHAMCAAADKSHVILMVEQTQRFDVIHETAKEAIDKGLIGKITNVKGRLGHSGPEYWNDKDRWYFDKKQSGGGAGVDVGIHILDLIRWLSGKEVSAVCANVTRLNKPYPVEDNVMCLLKFKDGSIGSFEASWTTGPYEVTTQFYGDKGKIKTSLGAEHPVTIELSRPKDRDPNCLWSEKPFYPEIPAKAKRVNAFIHFVDCIRKKKQSFISGKEGAKSLEVVLAAYESARTGKWVKLPLKG